MQETTRIFGIRAVIEAIESGKSIEKILGTLPDGCTFDELSVRRIGLLISLLLRTVIVLYCRQIPDEKH